MANRRVRWQSRPPQDRHSIKGKAHSKTALGMQHLAAFKNRTASGDLFRLFPEIVTSREFSEKVHGPRFPTDPVSILSTPRRMDHSTVGSEVVWAICSALQCGNELSRFVWLREELEHAVLANNREKAFTTLHDIESDFGWSIWLIQNRLSIVQLWDGLEEQRKLAVNFLDGIGTNRVLSIITNFISRRTEGTSVPGYLQSELNRYFPDGRSSHSLTYLRTKLFDLANPPVDTLAITLSVDAQASAIDYYETLISTLQAIVADEELCSHLADVLIKPAVSLYRRTKDVRLIPVLIAIGADFPEDLSNQGKRIDFIEAYTEGRYDTALTIANIHLAENPSDISAFVLKVRAELRGNFEQTNPIPGVLGEVAQHLRSVISFGGDTYAAALSLYTIYDRFYGHAWATYLRAIVVQELSQDQFDYPSNSLRRVLSLDRHITPFSALLESKGSLRRIPKVIVKNRVFPSTMQVYDLATTGSHSGDSSISAERQKRYLGRYYLSHGQYREAIENFSWIRDHVDGAEALRCGAAAVVALVRNNDLEGAVSATVSAYQDWPTVPTVLPLPELVSALESPENWPNSISLPLVFELYNSFFGDDRMTHLRYAFERFQLEHDITDPDSLRARVDEFGESNVIFYLSRVWRPEVMRQTVLYEGSRDIEDARIKVCRVLTEMDGKNSADYLSEIRERVKNQELAKATNLVDQSRVYVDISAIKKTLRSRLGDAYARYKSAMQSSPNTENKIVEGLEDIFAELQGKGKSLPAVLSKIHLEGLKDSELDVQFSAMFADVTNEFLRGDHGLNSYLSTRVRHGKLSNALRKPVADEFLVTERKEGTVDYVPNSYWENELSDLDPVEQSKVLSALEQFARDLDGIISHLRDDLIQVSVHHSMIPTGEENPDALFVYHTSNLERIFVQSSDKHVKNIDEFINLCVEALWEKTDTNLAKVQQIINTTTRTQLLNAFDHLTESLAGLNYGERLGDLHNHIARAKTSIQTKISTVSSWFKRSEVYDRQDFTLDFPALIARSMIRSTIAGATGWDGVQISINGLPALMPGRALDGMVDVFCALFENAIEHSGLNVDDLKVDVALELSEGKFRAHISNPTDPLTFENRDEYRIEHIRSEIIKSDTRRKAQKEGRSGFHKLWATVNAPQYRDPRLEFGYQSDGRFEVDMEFTIGVSDDEDSTHRG